jgi:hypothetical protein
MGQTCCREETKNEKLYTIESYKLKKDDGEHHFDVNINNDATPNGYDTIHNKVKAGVVHYTPQEEEPIVTRKNDDVERAERLKREKEQELEEQRLKRKLSQERKDRERMQAELERDQKIRTREQYIEDFYTDVLREAERRAGPFDYENNQEFDITNSELKKSIKDNNLKDTVLVVENEDSIYYGQLNEIDQKHGKGVQLQRGGIKREGYWVNDRLNPFGRYINKYGDVFEGNFVEGNLQGKGKLLKTTSTYYGNFKENQKHGFGIYDSSSEHYEGDFLMGKRHGNGNLLFKKSNNKFVGSFNDSKLSGKGKFTWANGDQYDGDIANGILHGRGRYVWKSGEEYIGNYIDGKREGYGEFKYVDGTLFKGQFKNNDPVQK